MAVVLPLLAVSAVGWTFVAHSDRSMTSVAAFLAAWLVMMIAMMLPAVAPVVGLYALAARRRVVAAVPVFIAGYLSVWALTGIPAYVIAQAVTDPIMAERDWTGRLVGATLIGAGCYQLTPLKAACLRRCRTPMSFYLTRTKSLSHPGRAFSAGAEHGLQCLGCCWALMAVLVVLGGMQLGWALLLSLVISAEKLAPRVPVLVQSFAAGAVALGLTLLFVPSLLTHLIRM